MVRRISNSSSCLPTCFTRNAENSPVAQWLAGASHPVGGELADEPVHKETVVGGNPRAQQWQVTRPEFVFGNTCMKRPRAERHRERKRKGGEYYTLKFCGSKRGE